MKKMIMTMLASILTMTTVLAACSSGDGQTPGQEQVLRIGIMSGDDTNSYVREEYVDNYILTKRGSVQVEIVPAVNWDEEERAAGANGNAAAEESEESVADKQYRQMVALLDADNPVDVLLLQSGDLNTIRKLARDNKLKPLEPLMKENKFDTEDLQPTVLNAIKDAGDGTLYALAPEFSANALYYNRTIFEEQGIEPPRDGMTWSEVFDLARRVTNGEGEDKVYGFVGGMYNDFSPEWVIDRMGAQLQLRTWNEDGTQMIINTPQWEELFTEVYNLQREGVWVPKTGRNGYSPDEDNFFAGQVAMRLESKHYMDYYDQAARYSGSDYEPIAWDIVSVPQHPDAPGIGFGMSLSGLVAINAKALNTQDAWDYLSFINGKQYAKVKMRSTENLMSRLSVEAELAGDYNVGAFSYLQPIPPSGDELEKTLNHWAALYAGEAFFEGVITGEKTVKEALTEWEAEANRILGLSEEEVIQWMDAYNQRQYENYEGASTSIMQAG